MAQVDLLRRKHAVALERKAAREAVTRLNLWRAFVNEGVFGRVKQEKE